MRVQLWEFLEEDSDEEVSTQYGGSEVINCLIRRDINLRIPEEIPSKFQCPKLRSLPQEYGRTLTEQLKVASVIEVPKMLQCLLRISTLYSVGHSNGCQGHSGRSITHSLVQTIMEKVKQMLSEDPVVEQYRHSVHKNIASVLSPPSASETQSFYFLLFCFIVP